MSILRPLGPFGTFREPHRPLELRAPVRYSNRIKNDLRNVRSFLVIVVNLQIPVTHDSRSVMVLWKINFRDARISDPASGIQLDKAICRITGRRIWISESV